MFAYTWFQLPIRIKDKKTTTGFLNIVYEILNEANAPLAGKSEGDRSEIRQWVEYVVVYIANADNSQSVNAVLKVSLPQLTRAGNGIIK